MSKKSAKNEKKVLNIISLIICSVLIISSLFITGAVMYLDILPMKYLVVFIGLMLIMIVLFSFVLLKKKFKAWIKILVDVISVIIITLFAIIFFYINRTYNFLDKITSRNTITEKYYVVVKKECEYTDVRDLVNDSVGTYDEKIELYNKAIKKFNKLVDAKLVKYDAVDKMAKELLEDKVKAIIISAAHKDTIDTDLEGFKDGTRILYTIEIEMKVDAKIKHPDINVTKDTFNIFLSGMDAYGNVTSRGRSDVNMLITVNPNTYEVLLTSIPRDYYVQLHGTVGNKDKLTHAGFYGTEMSINTVQDFLGVKIDYYIKVNFSTLINIVDIIGGVDVYSDKGFKPWTNSKIYINKGMIHMDGSTALAFARERHAYLEGDRHRVQNQQDVITAIINKLTSSTELLTKYTTLLNSVSNSLDTNIDMKNITSLIKLQLNKKPTWTIKKYSLNGTDSYNYTYTYGNQQLYVMNPIQDTINTARNYINGIINGKKFSELGIN